MTFKYLSNMYIYLKKYNRKNADVLGYWSVHLEKKTIWLSILVFLLQEWVWLLFWSWKITSKFSIENHILLIIRFTVWLLQSVNVLKILNFSTFFNFYLHIKLRSTIRITRQHPSEQMWLTTSNIHIKSFWLIYFIYKCSIPFAR